MNALNATLTLGIDAAQALVLAFIPQSSQPPITSLLNSLKAAINAPINAIAAAISSAGNTLQGISGAIPSNLSLPIQNAILNNATNAALNCTQAAVGGAAAVALTTGSKVASWPVGNDLTLVIPTLVSKRTFFSLFGRVFVHVRKTLNRFNRDLSTCSCSHFAIIDNKYVTCGCGFETPLFSHDIL